MIEEDQNDYIYITNEEGNEDKFEVIYEFEHEGKNYILVVPTDFDNDEEEAEVLAFRYEEDQDGLKLETIDDDKEWDMVEEVFNTLNHEFEV